MVDWDNVPKHQIADVCGRDIMPSWSYMWLLPYVGDYTEWDNAIAIMHEEIGA